MQQKHIRSIDLNLLPVLDALLRHRSVSLAAAAVNLSQPATSRALGRLRMLLDDPLLVRGPRGFVLSERAMAIRATLGETLDGISAIFIAKPLDPAVEERTFRIAMSDAHGVLLMPALIARLARDAPGITIVVATYGPDLAERMADGSVDIVVALTTTPLPPGAVSRPLARDRVAVVMRGDHPAADRCWALEDYARWPSVAIALIGDGTSDLDTLLARAGITRSIVSVVPNFITALSIVGSTDAVTTVSRAAAERFSGVFGLTMRDPPFAEAALDMTMVTAAARRNDRLLDWLCDVIRDEATAIFGAG